MQLIEKVKEKPCIADNIINIYLCLGLYISEDMVNFLLNISNQVDVVHDGDLEDLLVVMSHKSEYKVVIRAEKPLIEEKNRLKTTRLVKP